MGSVLETVRHFLLAWGYWAIAIALLLENAGVPVPGETILLLASAASYQQHQLRCPWIVAVGTSAATTGDNIGYWIGRRGGRPLLDRWKHLFRVHDKHISTGEALIEKHGPVAIFFARFIAGARIFAGPLAGVLNMHWPRFAFFNFLGALTWVTLIASIGHLFGSQLDRVMKWMRDANWIILVVVTVGLLALWWHRRRAFSE